MKNKKIVAGPDMEKTPEEIRNDDLKKGMASALLTASIEFVKKHYSRLFRWLDRHWNRDIYLMTQLSSVGDKIDESRSNRDKLTEIIKACEEKHTTMLQFNTVLNNLKLFVVYVREGTEVTMYSASMKYLLNSFPLLGKELETAAKVCDVKGSCVFYVNTDDENKFIVEEHAVVNKTGSVKHIGLMINENNTKE